jgi:adenosylhomocysteine nucleosidase
VSTEPRAIGYVLAVTGLNAEAKLAERSPRVRAVAGGGDAAGLDKLIEAAITSDCRGIISFGIAGGLSADLKPGACIVGRELVHESGRYQTNAEWTARLQARIDAAIPAAIADAGGPLATSSEKQALHAATGAAAVDMESYLAARAAAARGLPFAILRVVADPSDRSLPAAALAGMRADGSTDVLAVLRSLAADPRQVPQLVRLAADAARAYRALLRCHRLLGPGLGLFDLG